jgi:hypothetical protein
VATGELVVKKAKPTLTSLLIVVECDHDYDTDYIGEWTDRDDEWNIHRETGQYVGDMMRWNELLERATELFCLESDNPGWEMAADWLQEHGGSIEDWSYLTDHHLPLAFQWGNRRDHTYAFFKPYAGGEKPGTEDYKAYGLQNWRRMEALNNGDWWHVGIMAEARVSTPGCVGWQTFKSNGLWGVESDAGHYLKDLAKEELAALKGILKDFGVSIRGWVGMKKKALEELTVNV